MNNRDYKHFAEGEIYHVYNRGVGKMDIFRDHDDYMLLISRLREALHPAAESNYNGHHCTHPTNGAHCNCGAISRRVIERRKRLPAGAFTLIAYCLMPNHYHLLIRQNSALPISTLMLNVFGGYSKYFNKRYERIGSLFQDQFKAVRIDTDEYLRWVSAYIHANPVVAGFVGTSASYPYSSYLDQAGQRGGTLCDASLVMSQFRDETEYASFVADASAQIAARKDLTHLCID